MIDDKNSEVAKISFPRDLGLSEAKHSDLEDAASAIAVEYQLSSYAQKIHFQEIVFVKNIDEYQLYRISLGQPLRLHWTWEGSSVFLPVDERGFENGEQIAIDRECCSWQGQVVECSPHLGELFVVAEYPLENSQHFYIHPFEFIQRLNNIYNSEDFFEVRRDLCKNLHATKGHIHPYAKNTSYYRGIPSLQDLWQHSWGVIWGPPGTGKTYTIGQQVSRCIENSQERILVVSTTNKATDEVAISIGKALKNNSGSAKSDLHKVIRLGRGVDYQRFVESDLQDIVECDNAEIHNMIVQASNSYKRTTLREEKAFFRYNLKRLRRRLGDDSGKILQHPGYSVVVTTVFKAISCIEMLEELVISGKSPFTTVIIDEAGIISRAATAVLALLASRRVVLVGDPRQLSPITQASRIIETEKAMWLAESALGHLQAKIPHPAVHMLDTQYRMHPQIREIISKYQYDDALKDAIEVVERDNYQLDLSELPRVLWYVPDDDNENMSDVRAKRPDYNQSWVRPCTIDIVSKLLKALPCLSEKSGLFLSPFSAQISEMRQFFYDHNIPWQAATVHSQQGAEEDFVIFDTVKADSVAWSAMEWQRLINVALSRAREFVILICSRDEMSQVFLQPLLGLLAPYVVKKNYRKHYWKLLSHNISYHNFQEIKENPHLLGHQIASRKSLRPVLSAEQQKLCEYNVDGKPRLVRGVAGSGKTVVLAHWLVKALEQDSNARIYVLYANKSLHHLILGNIHSAWKKYFADTSFPAGRITLMHIRDIINELLKKFSMRWIGDDFDYNQQAKRCLDKISEEKLHFPVLCDALFIDEAQDFGPHALELVFRIAKPSSEDSRSVMIFYDNAQNIYARATPKWSDLGLEMRGRSTVMKESFRSTNPICEFALNVLYRMGDFDNADHRELLKRKLIEETSRNGKSWWKIHYNHIDGPRPTYHECDDIASEIEQAGDQIVYWIETQKVTPKDICILCNRKTLGENVVESLRNRLQSIQVNILQQTSSAFSTRDNTIIVTTPHSYKGYDAEIIVIMGVDEFATQNGMHAQSLYVAMTRARSILALYGRKRYGKAQQITEMIRECIELMNTDDASLEALV